MSPSLPPPPAELASLRPRARPIAARRNSSPPRTAASVAALPAPPHPTSRGASEPSTPRGVERIVPSRLAPPAPPPRRRRAASQRGRTCAAGDRVVGRTPPTTQEPKWGERGRKSIFGDLILRAGTCHEACDHSRPPGKTNSRRSPCQIRVIEKTTSA